MSPWVQYSMYARTLSLIEIDPESEPTRASSQHFHEEFRPPAFCVVAGRWGKELRSVFYPVCPLAASPISGTEPLFFFFFFFFSSSTLMQQSIRPTFLTSDRGSDEEPPRISSRVLLLTTDRDLQRGGLGGGPSAFPFDPSPFTDPLPH